ncbi:uncharacterized protein BX663DRAFT_543468 [Cokeromyces recurvatus]|uniref:uncharacterized protein n=1 Tax=Cokeromyces recurvatus TaxID=90255 RepID=UPI0022202E77|nr:uncharacterized protein BX663DRAFT_543468 [Cokeromyces recurvatus]KAI7902488.1 hypothetical protein BX663DRAFT_543468 [Cokeromyces recurvatus]
MVPLTTTATLKVNPRKSSIELKMTPTTIRKGSLSSSETTHHNSVLKMKNTTKKKGSSNSSEIIEKSQKNDIKKKKKEEEEEIADSSPSSPTTAITQNPLHSRPSVSSYVTRRTLMASPPPPVSAKTDFSSHVKSKIGSFENINYKPTGGTRKKIFDERVTILKQRIETKATSKVGSMENVKHKSGGGQVMIFDDKAAFIKSKQICSKVGSKDNIRHKPGGGEVKIYDDKASFIKSKEIKSKVRSLDNVKHKPRGGDIMIYNEKLKFKETSSPRIDAGSSTRTFKKKIRNNRTDTSSTNDDNTNMISPISMKETNASTSKTSSDEDIHHLKDTLVLASPTSSISQVL